jgi:hypothetical protein
MLHTRYNENGTKILCELKDISQIESTGYKYKDDSHVKSISDEVNKVNEISNMDEINEAQTKEIEKIIEPKKKPIRRAKKTTQMEKTTKDIVLT